MKKALICLLIVSLLPVAMAETYTYTDEAGYTWEYESCASHGVGPNWSWAELELVSVSPSPVGKMMMPNSIRGYDVVSIDWDAFNGLYLVTEIIFPNKLRNIGNDAFRGCTGLRQLILPNTVTKIGWGSFSYCTGLTKVVLSSGMSYIGDGVFYNCTALEDVTIPNSITKMGYAFGNCTSLKSIVIPDSVTCIGNVFQDCTALRYLVLGRALTETEWSSQPFSGCTMLWNIVNLSPLQLTKGEGIAQYAKNIYTAIPPRWGDLTPVYYTIAFEANGGLGEMADLRVAFGDTFSLPQNTFSRYGYTFTGWKRVSGSGNYKDGEVVSNLADDEGEIVCLNAIWEGNKYYVRFYPNGGEGDVSVTEMKYGSSYSLYKSFSRQGYSLMGWATSADGGMAYRQGVYVSNLSAVNGAVVDLYAVWEKDKTCITFDSNEGTGYMNSQWIESGETQALSSNQFHRTGYTFIGWSQSRYYDSIDYEDGADYTSTQLEYITLYAIWKANTYTVKFDLQGAADVMQDRQIVYGNSAHIPYYNGRGKVGYEFQGWALSPGGNVVVYDGGYIDTVILKNNMVPDGGEITLYAVWQGVECWVIFSANGGTGNVPYMWPRYGEEFTLPANGFTRPGYSFIGWAAYPYREMVDKIYNAGDVVMVSNLMRSTVGMSYMTTVWVYALWENDVPTPVITSRTGNPFENTSTDIILTCNTNDVEILYTTDGSSPLADGKKYKLPFTIWRTTIIKAVAIRGDGFASDVATKKITRGESLSEAANLYGYTMETDSAAPWTGDAAVSHDGVSSVRSGAIGNNGTTYLMASVKKAGTVSFWWKAQCEEPDEEDGEDGYYDYGAFLVDDDVKARIAGNDTGWRFVSVEVPTGGKHVLRWEYRKDGATSYAPDCVWVDQVQWIPADGSGYTLTSPEPVPYSWLSQYGLGVASGDFEAAANAASGKLNCGRPTEVWEEYVAGLDPTNANSQLKARIEMQGATPLITWNPNLNEDGVERRLYKIYGSETLENGGEWQYPTNSLHRFFKVTVEMP